MSDTRPAELPPDRELLVIQAEALLNERGRLADLCGMTLGTATDGQIALIGSEVPDTLAADLAAIVAAAPTAAPHLEPPSLAVCRSLLEEACGSMHLHAGPYYVFASDVRAETRARIIRSDGPGDVRLRARNPGNWDADEWSCLLDGALGPWAMALLDARVISICHTPRPLSPRAAECGVWTHPDYRGQGHAAAVTAAWADILRPSGRFLFYSTTADNQSSQRVAARLGLRLIGWTWNLQAPPATPPDDRHPLMRQRPAPQDGAGTGGAAPA